MNRYMFSYLFMNKIRTYYRNVIFGSEDIHVVVLNCKPITDVRNSPILQETRQDHMNAA